MGTQLRVVLTTCIVNLAVIPVQLHDWAMHEAGLSNTHYKSKMQKDFYKQFNCLAKNDEDETYRAVLENEIAEEQRESRMARNRNARKKRNSNDCVNTRENRIVVKRGAPAEQLTTRLWGQNTDGIPERYRAEDIIDTEEEDATPRRFSYGTTMNYPSKQDALERADRSPNALYRKVVESSINLFWGQQEQLSETRVRERRIRKKTKPELMGLSVIIEEAYDYMRRKLSLLGDKLCNPRYNHPDPMNVESVRFFENTWNKVETFLNNSLEPFDNIECEVGEIRLFMKRARRELPVRFEYIGKLIRNLRVAEVEMHNFTTTEGPTEKPYVLSVQKSLRHNESLRASIQRK